jgi:hypothetical protein
MEKDSPPNCLQESLITHCVCVLSQSLSCGNVGDARGTSVIEFHDADQGRVFDE